LVKLGSPKTPEFIKPFNRTQRDRWILGQHAVQGSKLSGMLANECAKLIHLSNMD
jgi:hypothetical protein